MAKKVQNDGFRWTPQKRLFVLEYLKDQNGKQAAIRAEYSPRTAEQQASRLLTAVKVREAISVEMEKRNKRVKVDADYVLQKLQDITEMDVFDILTEDMHLRPLGEWPKVWRTSLSGMDIHEIFERSGNGEEGRTLVETIVKKIKWPDKIKTLELMGKHIDVQAFKDRIDHLHNVTLEQLVTGKGLDGAGSDK